MLDLHSRIAQKYAQVFYKDNTDHSYILHLSFMTFILIYVIHDW